VTGAGGGDVLRAAGRGVLGSMAMTGMRRMTTAAGLVKQAPPEEVAWHGFPSVFARVPPDKREEAVELAHWAFGAAAGAGFALLPDAVRRRRAAGPVYALVVWAGFELLAAPALGLPRSREPRIAERIAIAADHVLYGAVIAPRGDRG
jgi:hypothetical protein